MAPAPKKTLGVVLFPVFELLDVFGPLEMFGNLKDQLDIVMIAERPGPVESAQGPKVHADVGFSECPKLELLLVPGGMGTRQQVENPAMLQFLRARAAEAEIVMSVCTGSGLLAKAGVLDGKQATSNKKSFAWASSQSDKVAWVKKARWVDDGERVTSSGVSAGMDMALAVITRLFGEDTAERLALYTEYDWHREPSWDPFADKWP
jgi:transcriptional regulator GlxA family with amidase domain